MVLSDVLVGITDQYDGDISRGVDAPDVLVQRLDGAVAVVVRDGEN